jgi:hypothetical protein
MAKMFKLLNEIKAITLPNSVSDTIVITDTTNAIVINGLRARTKI